MAASAAKPIVVVFGSTGAQGGSVVEALLSRGRFAVRACTRNPESEKAIALGRAGCEVVKASYNDAASVDAALSGAYGCWFITSTWEEGGAAAERGAGAAVARAAKKHGLKHVVFSTLEPPSLFGFEGGFLPFDNKGSVEQSLLYAGVPSTFVNVAWYMNNMEMKPAFGHSGFNPPVKQEDGSYLIEIPIGEAGLHCIQSTDVGECCASMLERPSEFIGRKVSLSSELVKGEDIQAAFEAAFPAVTFRYSNPTIEEFKAACAAKGFGTAVATMYSWYQFRMPEGGDVELTRELNPKVQSLAEYVATHKDRWDFA
jgi:uncharacterized protein YbjT (DUF2867 family)